MRKQIFNELAQAKYQDTYLALYLSLEKRIIQISIMIIVVLFAAASFVLKTPSLKISIITVIIPFVYKGAQYFYKIIVKNNKKQKNVILLKKKCYEYYIKVEKLWNEYHNEKITEEKTLENYYKLKTEFIEIEKLDVKLNVHEISFLKNRAQSLTEFYLINNYN